MRIILALILFVYLLPVARAAEVITLVTDPWPPYYVPTLKQQGFLTEIARQACERSGYQLEVKFMPWNRALKHARMGVYDGTLGAYYTQERARDFFYTRPLADSRVVFFALKDNPIQYTGLKSLQGLSVGVMNGYHYSDAFNSSTLFQRVKANTLTKSFERLLARRVDLVISDQLVAKGLLKSGFSSRQDSQIKSLEPALKVNPLYILVSKLTKNAEQKQHKLDLALEQMRADGSLQKILQAHGF